MGIAPDELDKPQVLKWLEETDEGALEELWAAADRVRRASVGDEVHLRGLVEVSNHCVRRCAYCGIRADNAKVVRYRMELGEILACARKAHRFGYGTLVMQAGEDYGITREWMARVVRGVRDQAPLAVTLSLGERPREDLAAWREAGADRYLLRFETSDPGLYARVHPAHGNRPSDRMAILRDLRAMGYEVGSGVMVGIPGQRFESLAEDVLAFREMDLDMIGVGPYIPHPETPLGKEIEEAGAGDEQVPNDELTTLKVVALARLVCPEANIPSTTALATLDRARGRELGLSRGANVVMPNLTPVKYRALYEIYPGKACINETAEACNGCLAGRIRSIGRTVGQGQGGRRRGAE